MKIQRSQRFKEVDSLNQKEKKFARLKEGRMMGGVKFQKGYIKNNEERRVLDDDLLHLVCEKIIEVKFLSYQDLHVEVENGIVRVEGEVSNHECKKIIEEVITTIPGVRRLESLLSINETFRELHE